jgi:hypothetical protein
MTRASLSIRQGIAAALQAIILLCAGAMLAPAGTAQAPCRTFVGNVGGAPAQMCLKVEGQAVGGFYFYFRYQTPISLAGSLDTATGAFTLTENSNGAESGKWAGTLDAKQGVISGSFLANGAAKPVFFYDASREPLRTEKHEQKTYDECNYSDPDRISYPVIGFEWDEITAIANPAVADAIRPYAEQRLEDRAKFSKDPTSPPTCREKAWEYNEDTFVSIAMAGKYLVVVTTGMSGYTGGAHGYEGETLKYFDLRSGKEVPFLDLFTRRGQDMLMERVKADIAKESKGEVPASCKIDLKDVWKFSFQRGSYIPWRLEGKRDRTNASPEDLRFWNISYGTYAFGCTGRPGYEMYDLPDEVVAHELNPVYFDPATKFFYK